MDMTKEQWVAFLHNLNAEDITWVYPYPLLYACGNKLWVPLFGVWGAVSYAPLLVQRQFESQFFIPQTFGLDQLEFDYGVEDSVRKVCQPNLVTPEYVVWRSERVNDGFVLLFTVIKAFNIFFWLPLEAEIIGQELYTKRREWEREKEELQRQVFELQLDVKGMGDHLTVAAKRPTRLALIEDEKPFGDREDTTKLV
ncbi:hypothetical protein FXO38_06868 [Capsicum annuum]|uniref:DUF7745 domain-containing protein n=1 Tax=Capsicum annuum TaxID=4072 RepID=A0A2G2YL54_CAPAN|nr:hypothetical protein FXO37_18072 [Capsicum annuum]KAF3670895.1 hypothetical protein FXO38_06868 [Capsicum annuum]PHT70331.1 hypothetical protein T459_25435 [Capsicum annuum]